MNFRSQVGRSRFTVLSSGVPEFEFETEVFPTKLDYESDYHAMLAQIEDLMGGLVLEYLRSTFTLGASAIPLTPTRLEWLILLKHVLADLEKALAQVARRPHWGLVREARLTPVARVRRSDASIRKAVRTGRGSGPRQQLASGTALREKIPETRSLPTLDTPEHRWIAAQLRRVSVRIAELIQVELDRATDRRGSQSDRSVTILSDLETFQRRISQLERLAPIVAATRLPSPGFGSLLLLASPGYSEAYRCLTILQLGLRVTGGPLELSLKDLHVLYEYWTYLAVLKIAAEETGCPIAPEDLLSVEQYGLQVRVRQGRQHDVRLKLQDGRRLDVTYNPLFGGKHSIVPQRPDIVLTLHDRDRHWPRMRLLLDAKYRLDDSDEYVQRFGVTGPPLDAINVLHRYRDAILEELGSELPELDGPVRTVIEGAILFPGPGIEGSYYESPLVESLERLGIGALPFLPGTEDLVREWIRGALQGESWSLAVKTIAQAALSRHRTLQKHATEGIAVVPPFGGYRAASLQDWQPGETREFSVLGVDPRELSLVGVALLVQDLFGARIERIAEVSTERVKATEAGGLRLLLRLNEWTTLAKPIRAAGLGARAGSLTPVLTSRLAIMRAKSLDELYLTSVAEWRLLDALDARGMEYAVLAPKPRAAEQLDRFSTSVRLRVADRTIAFARGRYEVSSRGASPRVFASGNEMLDYFHYLEPDRCSE